MDDTGNKLHRPCLVVDLLPDICLLGHGLVDHARFLDLAEELRVLGLLLHRV